MKLMKNNKVLYPFYIAMIALMVIYGFNRDNRNFEITKNMDIFYSMFRELNLYYVDSIKPEELIKKSMDEMLSTLDPYTVYIPEEDMDDFKTMTTGEYGGIGSMISQRDGMVMITDPYEGKPAQRTGLQAGDIILEVGGKKMEGKKVSDVSENLKGEPGTTFTIKVKRDGHKKPLNFELTREKIVINPVPYYGMYDGDIGYITLSNFTDKAAKEVEKALLDLKSKGAKAFVLDLRSNPGGILDEAVKICNLFIDKGQEIVSTKGKVSQWDKTYKTMRDPVDTESPLAILVSRGSASASEIVAGALQDLDRAVVVGNRTFGKGLVQTTRPLSYKSSLKVTTAKYYIPSGRCIQALDYTHRNEDGSVGRIPDSLITDYHTKNGRLVKDGGGVMPDVKIDYDKPGNITYSLIQKFMVFDYATKYAQTHDKMASPQSFNFSDADYKDFISFVTSKEFDYKTKSVEELKDLKKLVAAEGYDEETEDLFAELEKSLTPDLEKDMKVFKEEISALLSQEIAKRYFYHKGEAIEALKSDKGIKKCAEVLRNSTDYTSILAMKE